MAEYFSLGDVIPVCVTAEPSEEYGGGITICKTKLHTGRFDGAWFTSFPLSLCSDAKDAAWVMTVTHANGNEETFFYETAKIQPTLASYTPGDSITFIATKASIVDAISTPSNSSSTIVAIYDVTGKIVPTLQRGLNIVFFSDGTHQKIIHKQN